MGKSTRYLESPATAEENSFDYRVEWEHRLEFHYEGPRETWGTDDLGPGEELYVRNYDQAYDRFCSCSEDPHYRGVSLIRIYPDGHEILLQYAK